MTTPRRSTRLAPQRRGQMEQPPVFLCWTCSQPKHPAGRRLQMIAGAKRAVCRECAQGRSS